MRPSSVHSLNGGVTMATAAWPRKAPNRPSEATMWSVKRPRPSTGRTAAFSAGSGMHPVLAVHAERPQREVAGVEVVLEEEHAREARAVPEGIVPAAVLALGAQQVLDARLDRRARRRPDREEPQQRPRRLARDGRPAPGQLRLDVALARLAPPAVGVLVADQPAHRALHVLVPRVHAHGAEPAQDRPRAVDIVDAPASVPGAVVPLAVADELERALRRLELEVVAERAEQLEAAAGEVLGRGVDQGAVVGERDVVQEDAVVVGVGGRGAAAPVLPLAP